MHVCQEVTTAFDTIYDLNVVALTGTTTKCTTVPSTISRENAAPCRLISTPISLFSTLHGSWQQ